MGWCNLEPTESPTESPGAAGSSRVNMGLIGGVMGKQET